MINVGRNFGEIGSSFTQHQPPSGVTCHIGNHWHGCVHHSLCCTSAWRLTEGEFQGCKLTDPCVFISSGQQAVVVSWLHLWNFLCWVPLPRPPPLHTRRCQQRWKLQPHQWTVHTFIKHPPPPKKNQPTIHLYCSISQGVCGSLMCSPKTSRLTAKFGPTLQVKDYRAGNTSCLLQPSENPARGCAITSPSDKSHSCFSCRVAMDVWTGLNLNQQKHSHGGMAIHTPSSFLLHTQGQWE